MHQGHYDLWEGFNMFKEEKSSALEEAFNMTRQRSGGSMSNGLSVVKPLRTKSASAQPISRSLTRQPISQNSQQQGGVESEGLLQFLTTLYGRPNPQQQTVKAPSFLQGALDRSQNISSQSQQFTPNLQRFARSPSTEVSGFLDEESNTPASINMESLGIASQQAEGVAPMSSALDIFYQSISQALNGLGAQLQQLQGGAAQIK